MFLREMSVTFHSGHNYRNQYMIYTRLWRMAVCRCCLTVTAISVDTPLCQRRMHEMMSSRRS